MGQAGLDYIVIQVERGFLSADLVLVQVPSSMVGIFENRARPFIEDALRFSPPAWDVDSIIAQAEAKDIILFVFLDEESKVRGAVTVKINQYPLAKVLSILQLGSDYPMEELEDMFEELIDWSKSEGCDYGSIIGRPGWEKILPDWHKTNVRLINEYR